MKLFFVWKFSNNFNLKYLFLNSFYFFLKMMEHEFDNDCEVTTQMKRSHDEDQDEEEIICPNPKKQKEEKSSFEIGLKLYNLRMDETEKDPKRAITWL
jgi:hypothetical protein